MRHLSILFLVLAAGHGILHGAELTGSVEEESAPLAEVEIVLVNVQTGVILDRAYTDATGNFAFTVTTGTYNIGAFKTDYARAWRKAISVGEADISLRIELEPKAFVGEAASDDCE